MKVEQLIGQKIDNKYTVVEMIGRGGMGAVFRAQHTFMERDVAIKVLNVGDRDGAEEEFIKRFKQEAQTASQIRHPSAITIFDYGITKINDREECPYLVMEYVRGHTLKELIAEHRRLPPERIIPIMLQVFEALEEAHGLGIVHRDLKPENIMISRRSDGSDFAHVLDFGIAKVVTGLDSENQGMTKTGSLMGTPRYMAPEQVLSRPIDQRTDIYALGLILYEALSGTVPFDFTSIMELAVKHVNEEPELLTKRAPNANVPKTLERVIMRALAKDPAHRPDSIRSFTAELLSAYPVDYRSSSGSYRFSSPITQIPKKSLNPMYLGSGVVAVMVVGAIAYLMFSPPGKDATFESTKVSLAPSDEPTPPALVPAGLAPGKVTAPNRPATAVRETRPDSAVAVPTPRSASGEATDRELLRNDLEESASRVEDKPTQARKDSELQVAPQTAPTAVPVLVEIPRPIETASPTPVPTATSALSTTKEVPVQTAAPVVAATPDVEAARAAAAKLAAEREAAQKAEREKRAAAAAKEAEQQEAEVRRRRQAQAAQQAAAAAEAKEKAEAAAEEETTKPKIRRRCGPTWCLE